MSIHKPDGYPHTEKPPQLLRAIEEFNAGAYFACHETLEALWLEEKTSLRNLYKGILQVAAALLQLERGNYRGAVSLLTKATRYLRPFAPDRLHVDVARLIGEVGKLREALEISGWERFPEGERLPPLRVYLLKGSSPGKRNLPPPAVH